MFEIDINFDDTYAHEEVAEDISWMTFNTTLADGTQKLLKIDIVPHPDPMLPEVYNLAFGPLFANGDIDDGANLKHENYGKVFSTILLFCSVFLEINPERTIGLDGSDERRAYLYHKMLLRNRNVLTTVFILIGVDWYVKLLRNNDIERYENGALLFKPRPEPFDFGRLARDMYRYYMFTLRT